MESVQHSASQSTEAVHISVHDYNVNISCLLTFLVASKLDHKTSEKASAVRNRDSAVCAVHSLLVLVFPPRPSVFAAELEPAPDLVSVLSTSPAVSVTAPDSNMCHASSLRFCLTNINIYHQEQIQV